VKAGPLLFVGALVLAAASWFAVVEPLRSRAEERAGRLLAEDHPVERVRLARERFRAWPGPDAEAAARLENELHDYASPRPEPALDPSLSVDPAGLVKGRLPWTEVQHLLAWSAAQPRGVRDLDIRAVAEDPGLADCLVVLEPEAR